MKRLIAILAIVLAPSLAWAAGLPASLKTQAVIEGDLVRLSDLWDGLGDKGQTVVAAAPQPGKRITVDARWLSAVAQNYGVDWQPASNFDRIVVERAAQVVDPKAIEREIRETLALEGLRGNFDFEVSNRSALNIMVPTANPAEVAIRDMQWDPRTARFSATIEVPAGAPNAVRQRVNGRVFTTARVPMLTHTMNRGEVISEKDLEWVEVREEQVRRDIVTDMRQLVGQEPRYSLRQGTAIRMADVQRPVLVTRNSNVTLVLKTPFMTLTTMGKANEDGGKGDVIHVLNTQTKRVVEATVEGPGQVSVVPDGARVLSN